MSAVADESGPVYLRAYLAPLAAMLARADVTDIYVNRPGEVWVETQAGGIERHEAPELDETTLARLARQIAAISHQGISREHPLLSATLPDGARVQIVAPPATRGPLALAIRKHIAKDLTLSDYVEAGAFEGTRGKASLGPPEVDRALSERLEAGDVAGMLALAVVHRKNILVSGGTSTGKTTFLNALLREVPAEERLILIEDTPELRVRHENMVGLLAARSALGEAQVGANDLLAASLRMRPDRIILGELRGPEAFAFLRAVNTGHPGSMTTVHADSAERAIEQIVLLVLQAGTQLGRDDVRHYVQNTVDIFVQLTRVAGRRRVAELVFRPRPDEQASVHVLS
jgi:type IV secretion system protein VirB11